LFHFDIQVGVATSALNYKKKQRTRPVTAYPFWFKILTLFPMISVIPVDLWLSHALQGMGDRFTPVMSFFTWLGYPQAYMVAVAIIYWSVDRNLGLRLAIFLPLVASVNSLLKQALLAPRPYWVDPGIRAIRISNGFGMPSGHAQASIAWLYAARSMKMRGFWLLAVFIALMIGISRVYLGVHFSSQVITGWMTGIIILLLFSRYEHRFISWFLGRAFSVQLLMVGGTAAVLLILGAVILFFTRHWEMPLDWINHATDDLAGNGKSILRSRGLSAIAGNSGAFLGVALGALLDHRRGGFVLGGTWLRLLRSVAGLILITALYLLLTLISPDPDHDLWVAVWRFSGFFVISFFSIYLFPHLCERCWRSA
jgi:membrane-associated phospholipid phosphatase